MTHNPPDPGRLRVIGLAKPYAGRAMGDAQVC